MGAPFEVEQLLRATLKPALGCTEPVAVASAVAAAVQAPMGWLPGRTDAFVGDLDQKDIDCVRVAVNQRWVPGAIPTPALRYSPASTSVRSWPRST
ncbi:MAG: hypothetical protein H6Q05_5187 [Acidobacteria bacterium]|nr:hypothetical protein [Acidobacteriota bacterium]